VSAKCAQDTVLRAHSLIRNNNNELQPTAGAFPAVTHFLLRFVFFYF
jgi:hypothetical protein